jgi:antibiotic biosynthesis monooxygenase (ABM) superfamily enzyme
MYLVISLNSRWYKSLIKLNTKEVITMVLYVSKFNLAPDKVDDYMQWTPGALQRMVGAPGIKEVRVFLPVASDNQVVVTYEFANLDDWLTWGKDAEVQKVSLEFFRFALNPKTEVWNSSPLYPDAIRP